MWVSAFVFLLAIVSLVLVCREVLTRVSLMAGVQGHEHYSQAWANLGIKEKLKFFDYWVIFTILGNLFQIFAGLLTFITNNTFLNTHQIIMGFGSFFAWVGIVRFIDHGSVSYTIVSTLERSFSYISLYVFGVVPVFMGYAFLGICCFWQTGIYFSTPMSMIANFALVNGDSVYLFSFAGYQETPFLGQLYYYTFLVFFICCVHNIFIAIVEQSFSSLRGERRAAAQKDSSDEETSPGVMSSRQSKDIELKEKSKR